MLMADLPEQEDGTILVVSKIICEVCRDRDDLYMVTNVIRHTVTKAPIWAQWISPNPYLSN